ncbi:hypothetical protein HN51_034393 [Arachis hypogaea]|uniref:GATA transcription factor n=1 Tax=Arachis hypogaea TaxID=3818 RepID=A0A445A8G2_ARAHY|nr:GATA transcription factor 5 [Arachis ipaensis]XP_025642401.1 GATA transcription factor 5 [Arachis hypogaea]QHN99237.1 GATA transcription factor [Arachis hypogaea]QHN99238.1 GATA transcription factor [Arachis hypogaea]RYR22737.1 hypothetical protein Ahy_B03g068043 isoform A [Arachis hypogaea]RYR22738.1 hypothetical protein Ahy_B03g068043 isoform B [Arachis hypogaea]
MEVVVAKALKPSLRGELIFQPPLALGDEFLCFNAVNNGGAVGEDFSVDDLLDFSEFQHGSVGKGIDVSEEEEDEEDEEKDSTSGSSSQDRTENDTNSNSSNAAVDSDSIFAGELSVPDDDLADLEWVSHFVDDSIPELSLLYPVRSEQTRARAQPEPKPGSAVTSLPHGVPVKPRTTRTRKPNGRLLWSFGNLFSPPSSPSSCSSSVLSSTAAPLVLHGEPPAKKQKRKPEEQACGLQFQRRCSHCQVQKTPQWRTGPMGPKTLCNACGVRYKSGRLFPEYRPACSPTFSGDIHSNSHRKVLEMRRRKEMSGPEPSPDRAFMLPSC